MKKIVAYCPANRNVEEDYQKLVNSLRKFHSEEELPLIRFTLDDSNDPMKWYKATPMLAGQLLEEYETVIKFDADQLVVGSLSHILNDKDQYDIGVVMNANPREMKTYPVTVWDIHPLQYFNNGFVVMKNKRFVDHWWTLCNSPHFNNYQMKEQDLLNIMCHYGDYKVKMLDAGSKWHGLISKQYGTEMIVKDDKIILPKNDEWPTDEDKEIVMLHWAGGNDPNKSNYRIRYAENVVKRLDYLCGNNAEIKPKIE